MSDEVFERLREFLDGMPGGFPKTRSGVEMRILKKHFTPEDAETVMSLKYTPEPVSEIAKRLGMDEKAAAEKLEALAKKGLIFRSREGDDVKYKAVSFVIGIYEFQLPVMDREFAEMFEEYMPFVGMSMYSVKTKQLRTIPVGSSVEALPSIAPYDKVRDLVKGHDHIAVAQCICKKEQRLLGNKCERPEEICLVLGKFAQFYVDNGWARKISADEAMEVLDLAEESALVLNPSNTQDIMHVCCCCPCCCPAVKGIKLLPKPAQFVISSYQAKIDPDACSACGDCIERCQIDAISEAGDVMEVNLDRCIGCGLCVSTCPEEAIAMVEKAGAEVPPADEEEMLGRIMKERGLT